MGDGVEEGVESPGGGGVVKSITGAKPFGTVRSAVMVVVHSALTPCSRGSSSRAAPLDIMVRPTCRDG